MFYGKVRYSKIDLGTEDKIANLKFIFLYNKTNGHFTEKEDYSPASLPQFQTALTITFTKMNIEIRKAKEIEINTLLDFEKSIIEVERHFDNTLKDSEIHYYDLIELINSEKAEVLVAVLNNEIVGSGYAKILPAKNYQKYNEYAYLGFMYVKPEFRGQGINRQILKKLIEWTKDKNLIEVRLQVYNENLTAKNAYLKAGFKANFLEMRMEIS